MQSVFLVWLAIIICSYKVELASAINCLSYSGLTEATVYSYDSFSCAIQYDVPNIFINTSFTFQSTINIDQPNDIKISGIFPSIVLKTSGTYQMFNLSSNANVAINNIQLLGSFVSSRYIDYGGIFYLSNANLKLTNVTVQNGFAGFCGGAIYSINSNIQLLSSVFQNNIVPNTDRCSIQTCAGGIAIKGGSLTVTNSQFIGNAGTNGAISLDQTPFTISGSVFRNNLALSGGGVSVIHSSGSITNTIANNNSVHSYGGAFNFTQGSEVTMTDITCFDNFALIAGGCVCTAGSVVSLTHADLTRCVSANGGAIYSTDANQFLLDSAQLYGNEGKSGGGAIMVSNSSFLVLTNSNVSGNYAENLGGGIAVVLGGRMNITNSFVDSNVVIQTPKPVSFGGALYVYDSYLHIEGSTVSRSEAGDGSIMFAFNSNVTVVNTVMEYNKAISSGVFAGGSSRLSIDNVTFHANNATLSTSCVSCLQTDLCRITNSHFHHNHALDLGNIYIQLTTAEISNSIFNMNSVQGSGGSIFLSSKSFTKISGCTFTNNKAAVFGGAILIQLNSHVNIVSSYFSNNKAVSGGAVYVFDAVTAVMDGIQFLANSASTSGGSVFVGSKSVVTLQNLNITNSVSPFGGGVYCSTQSTVVIDNLSASHNTAQYSGGVLALFDFAYGNISNSVFTHNTAALGGVVSGQYETSLHISGSTFVNNNASEHGGVGYVLVNSYLSVNDSSFSTNSAYIGAGVFQVQISSVRVAYSQFKSNTAENGGCFVLENSDLTADSSLFSRNGAHSGGGVCVLEANSVITSSNNNYAYNSADNGGAFSSTTSSIVSSGDTFQHCIGNLGGCVFGIDTTSMAFSGATFTNNKGQTSAASVLYMEGGSLSLVSSVVSNNMALGYGAIALYATHLVVQHSNFTDNVYSSLANSAGTISGYAAGAALYIASQVGSSTGIPVTNNSVSISHSRFFSNEAGNNYGGAVYINTYPGTVSITSCVFTNNTALNGGAVSATSTNVTLLSNTFTHNKAKFGGGAVYWIYSAYTTTDVDISNRHSNNNASYGNFKATNLVRLNTSVEQNGVQASSGGEMPPIYVSLLDFYNQVVTNSSLLGSKETTVYASMVDLDSGIKGSSIEPSIKGVATFDEIIVTAYPGGNATMAFEVPITNISPFYLTISFRECVSGEYLQPQSDNQATCNECGLGTFSFYTNVPCAQCPQNAYCPGGNVLDLNNGYWRVDQVSSSIYQCPVSDVCLGGTNTSTQCATGQEGPYCEVCSPGYVENAQGLCYSCSSSSSLFAEMISTIVCVLTILCGCIAYKYRKKIMAWYSEKMDILNQNVKFRTMRVKGKIVLAFFQILYQIGPALDVVFPVNFTAYLNYYSFFQLDIINLPDVNCLVKAGFYDSLLVSTLFPPILFAGMAILFQLAVVRARRLNERHPYYTAQKASRDTLRVAFLISYFVLVSVSTTIFQVYQCVEFDNGEKVLVADYSVSCYSDDYYFYRLYGTFMIFVYPVGIPVAYALVLFRYRKRINPDWRLVIDGKEKVLVSDKVIQHEKIKVRNTYDNIKNISFLYDNYTPKRWYFELFDCVRRLCLGAVPVLIIRGSVMQIIIVLLISLASVGVFMYFKPYIHEMDSNLAIMAQWSITLVLISALIIKVEAISGENNGLGVVLILINVFVVAFSIVSTVLSAKPKKKKVKGERDVFEDGSGSEESDDGEDSGGEEKEGEKSKQQEQEDRNGEDGTSIEMNPIHKTKTNTHIESVTEAKRRKKREKKLQKQHKKKKHRNLDDEQDSDDEEDYRDSTADGAQNDYESDEEGESSEEESGGNMHAQSSANHDSDDEEDMN